jgi:hypothetical protein
MEITDPKPKLLFFQFQYDKQLPVFLLNHKREHVQCLSQFFDVTVISQDGDYQQLCEKYQPELVLVESGVPNPSCRRLKITNVRACPGIPKLGFLHSDAFCCARAGFLSDMDHWGIETFFAIATTAAEHTPAIASNLFSWPNFIDPEIYRDYSQWKSVPVLFTGNRTRFYPWRQEILRVVSKRYPSLLCPHPGYSARKAVSQIMVGESYARMLNASWFVPACGTVAKEVVRKHFEISACNACLIAEKSPALEAAGFVDMTNCVIADGHDVLDRLDFLFQNRDRLNTIISAGHQLVHTRHTIKHRDQIFQWFNLHKNLGPDQKIVQLNPFEPLTLVNKSKGLENVHVICHGIHLELLREGDRQLWQGNYASAGELFRKAGSYIPYMPEPKVKLALCCLYEGNAKEALSWILEPNQFILAEYKAADPDPIEWAYLVITLLCLGKVDEAFARANEYAWLYHPELDRVRWVVDVLKNNRQREPLVTGSAGKDRLSIHQLPARSFEEWIEQLCIMLRACGQHDLAEKVTRSRLQNPFTLRKDESGSIASEEISDKAPADLHKSSLKPWLLIRGRSEASVFLKRRLWYTNLKLEFRRLASQSLHHLENRYRYFLPYNLSESRNDEFYQAVRNIASEEEIKTVLIIGAAAGKGSTEALLAGAGENQKVPSVFCISHPKRRLLHNQKAPHLSPSVKWYQVEAGRTKNPSQGFARMIETIKRENRVESFDLVLVDGSAIEQRLSVTGSGIKQELGAKFVILDDLRGIYNYKNHNNLLRDPSYFLVTHNPGLRNGYAIFEKRPISRELEVDVEAQLAEDSGKNELMSGVDAASAYL